MAYNSIHTGTKIDEAVTKVQDTLAAYFDIGIPGKQGFGVGIVPPSMLPDGMSLMPGTETPGSDNWGNYQYQDGSIVVCVVAHWMKVGTGSNGLDVNAIDAKPYGYFASEAEANAAGYFLPRAFTDGCVTKLCYFDDKYEASKNAWGTGFIASSIKNGLPISTASAHHPIADLTACAGNYYYEAVRAAHARDGEDGAVNAASNWFCCSRFIYINLAMLAMAHGQAATSTTHCAWYDGTGVENFPKGNNNNALGDYNDPTVSYTTDGYPNCGLTGSGAPFAKTTHNGQACGVADLNGNLYEISLGVTCIAAAKAIEDITRANPASVQITAHGYTTADQIVLTGIAVGNWASLDDKLFSVTVIDENNFSLDGVDSTAFDTAYVSGTNAGSITSGVFYAASESTAMKGFTHGNTLDTDHWGATGVAAMMTEFTPVFETGYPSNGFAQRMGSGTQQVLSEAVDGNGAVLRSVGMPATADGVDTTGTNQFGKDYFYQHIVNDLCVLSGGPWSHSSSAGVWYCFLYNSRASSSNYVGFRCACYPV